MDNTYYKDWIVRYTRHNEDGSVTQFHAADFGSKAKAERFIRKKCRSKSANEEYRLIDNRYEF